MRMQETGDDMYNRQTDTTIVIGQVTTSPPSSKGIQNSRWRLKSNVEAICLFEDNDGWMSLVAPAPGVVENFHSRSSHLWNYLTQPRV